jgi:acid phosphatase
MSLVVDLGVYGPDGFTTTKRDTIPAIDPALNHSTIGSLARNFNNYEVVLHPGDFAYADDWFLKAQNLLDGKDAYQAILETFYDQLAPISSRKPYMASPGNHEANCEEIPYTDGLCPEGQHNFTDFRFRFGNTLGTAFASSSSSTAAQASAAKAQQLANPPFWYSFEYGQVHVIMFDTETDFPSAPDGPGGSQHLNGGPFGALGQQLAFLEADLASVDRTVTPWVFAAGHRPWYSTGGSDNVCAPCQAAFEPLFYKYGVDLGVFGHEHNSQSFNPVYNGTADPAGLQDPKAPMYVVAGGTGNIEGLTDVGSNYTTNTFAYAADFSYARVRVLDANNLGIDFYESSNDTLLYSTQLYKSHAQQFVMQ